MSRSKTQPAVAEPVVVKPTNDIYTVLAAVATVVVILGLVAVWMTAGEIFPGGLLGSN